MPHLLTHEQKKSRVSNDEKLLKMFHKNQQRNLNNVVTGDETWLYYSEPKRKCSNRVWATKNAVRPCIARGSSRSRT